MLETIRRIFRLLGDRKKDVQIAILYHLIRSLFASFDIFAILYVMTHLENLTMQVVGTAAAILGVGLLGKFICQWQSEIKVSATAYDVFLDKRLEVGERLREAPMGYFNDHNLGSIQAAVTTGLNELESNAVVVVENIIGNMIYCVITTIVLCFFNIKIGLVTLAAFVINLFLLDKIQKLSESFSEKQVLSREKMTGRVMEFVRGIMVMRLFSHKGQEKERVEEAFRDKKEADLTVENTVTWPVNLYNFIFRLSAAAIIALAAIDCLQGKMPFAYCIMFLLAAFLVNAQTGSMGGNIAVLKMVSTAMAHFEKVLDMPEMKGEETLEDTDGYDIKVNHVDFGYTKDRRVLHDVSMNIPYGSHIAVVGPSGSGKSTICNLIARFFDVDGGNITIGGKDVKDLSPDSVLKQMSFVFQNVYLFGDTVENNVKFGREQASHEDVVEACKKARCHDFIMKLPNGYDTVLTEGGSSLSGGEKQRISIARAMLKDARIIVLDEATSSVDPENEYLLVEALEELSRGKTLISIAHRLSTVSKADEIYVFNEGRVVQRGTHAELMKEEGIYKRFIEIRAGSMKWAFAK